MAPPPGIPDGRIPAHLRQLPISNPAVAAMMREDLASAALGILVQRVGPGSATVTMPVGDTMVNGHGICHGGYIFTVADTAFACACNSHGPVTVAAAADITFVAPARLGDVLTAVAEQRTGYGRNGIYDVTVSNEAGVVAEFRGRSRQVGR